MLGERSLWGFVWVRECVGEHYEFNGIRRVLLLRPRNSEELGVIGILFTFRLETLSVLLNV